MVTSLPLHNSTWMDGVQVTANDLRLQSTTAHLSAVSPYGTTGIAARPGVRYGTGSPLLVQAASGMNVTINAGFVFVQGTASATAGMYEGCLDTTGTLTVATSDPTNPRIDNVIARFVDNGNSSSTATVELQTGTPAPSPVAPTPPANSQTLATIAVGAGVTSITSANIVDKRFFTAASGGIVPFGNVSGGIAGPAGLYVHDLSSGRLRTSDGAGNAAQPKTALFAPASVAAGNQYAPSTAWNAFATTSVTVDGATEIEAFATWQGFYLQGGGPATVNDELQITFGLNGTTPWTGAIKDIWVFFPGISEAASSIRAWMTPPAGTSTITAYARNWNISAGQQWGCTNFYFRVQANTSA